MHADGRDRDTVTYPRPDRSDRLTEADLEHGPSLYAGEVRVVDRTAGGLLTSLHAPGYEG